MNDLDAELNLNEIDEKISSEHKDNLSNRLCFTNQTSYSNSLYKSFYSTGRTHMNLDKKKITIKYEHEQIPKINGDINPATQQKLDANVDNISCDISGNENILSPTELPSHHVDSQNPTINNNITTQKNIEEKAKKEIISNIPDNLNLQNQLLNQNLQNTINLRFNIESDFYKIIKSLRLNINNQVSKKQVYYILDNLHLHYENQDLNILLDLDNSKVISLKKLKSFISVLSKSSNILVNSIEQEPKANLNNQKASNNHKRINKIDGNKSHSSRYNNAPFFNKKEINISQMKNDCIQGKQNNEIYRKNHSSSPNFLHQFANWGDFINTNLRRKAHNLSQFDLMINKNKIDPNLMENGKLKNNFENKIEKMSSSYKRNRIEKDTCYDQKNIKQLSATNQLNNYTKMSEKINTKKNSNKTSNSELWDNSFLSKLFTKNIINPVSSRLN